MKTLKYLTLFVSLLITNLVLSKEIIVTSTADSGSGTLREAVGIAQPNDTIIINVKGEILLNSTINFNTSDITVIGPYPKHNNIKSSTAITIFQFSANDITLKGLGFVGSTNVYNVVRINNASNIKFIDCLFENNFNSFTGTINSNNSQFEVINSAFINNQSSQGGAININGFFAGAGETEIKNCTFYQNNSNSHGGSIYATGNTSIILANNLFKENTASGQGQAIQLYSGTITMYNNIIQGNGSGSDNQTTYSSGVYITGGGNYGNVLVQNSSETNAIGIQNSFPFGTNLNLRPTIKEDGYGLKYFTIVPFVNGFNLIDIGSNGFILPDMNEDCRRAPRILYGGIDPGPCEFTSNIITNPDITTGGQLDQAISAGGFIEFDFPSGPYVFDLPNSSITDVNVANTYIDGFSQPGSAIPGPSLDGQSDVTPAVLPIEFTTSSSKQEGILISASNVTIAGLDIHSFDGYGINTNASANNAKIFGNHIGFNGTSGSYTVYENKICGVALQADNIILGGHRHFQRNVISGNGLSNSSQFHSNVLVLNKATNKIFGNFIGAQPEGSSSFNLPGASQYPPGIYLRNTTNCTVGDSIFGSRNLIVGNLSEGIKIYSSSNISINNNFIGVGIDGLTPLGNATYGIYSSSSSSSLNIGNAKGNIISDNGSNGIYLNTQISNNYIENNIIGLGIDSATALGNNADGINVYQCNNNIYISSNIISSNAYQGVFVFNSPSVYVDHNIIGTDGTGNTAKANGANGIYFNNTTNCQIKYNLISGNTGDGILLDGNGSGTQVFGNLIGTDSSGQNAIPNAENGINIDGNHEATIGSGFSQNNNVISGNTKSGIHVNGSSSVLISGNNIGLSKDQSLSIGNQEHGINLTHADNVKIGDIDPNKYNTISGNTLNGIMLDSSDNTSILNCIIGTDSSQTLIAGNGQNGIYVYHSNNHNIGVGAPNVIVNHTSNNAILLETVTNDTIQKNSIGVSNKGVTLPNGVGINLISSSQNNYIGGLFATQKNKIGGNTSGIKLDGSTVNNNDIVGNSIGLTDSLGYIVSKPNGKGIEIVNGADYNNIGEVNSVTKKNVISGNQTGIYLNDVKGTQIYRNYIGSDTNSVGSIQNYYGIHIDNCNDFVGNSIGITTNLTDGPIISGNYIGVLIDNNSQNQYIKNCRIGVKVGGTQSLPNTYGILIQNNSSNNIIGGSNVNESNLISGNDSTGIIINSCNNNFIYGNYIGTNISASDSLPNLIGIHLNSSDGNYIGSTISGDENVISSNTVAGLLLDNNSNNTTIVNNFFGTNSTGDGVYAGSGNFYGIYIKDFTTGNNTIGGDRTIGEGNTFSNTNVASIAIANTSSAQYIEGNKIGIVYDGSQTITNTFVGGTFGIYLKNSSNIIIGGTSSGAENSIAYTDAGVMITNSSNANIVSHNFIGNDTTGTNMLSTGLQGIGVRIDTSAHDNTIGPANVISGNDVGVRILNSGTSNNKITNNFIGVDFSGNTALPNNIGIEIGSGATNNLIGGIYSTDKNVISGNSQVAINIADAGTSGNVVSGNLIGLGIDESTVSNNAGIAIFDNANNNIIGGSIADSANYICSNNLGGVFIGTGANNNFVRGNKIGVKPDNSPSGNMASGIIIDTGNDNFIGGINSNEGNEIANNSGDGIEVKNSGTNNQFLGNVIHDNGGNGIDINIDGPTPNNTTGLQNNVQMPTILQAFDCSGGSNDVKVGVELRNLNSGSNYIIEFFDVTSSPDASGYGEANAFIQRFNYTAINTTDTAVFSIVNYSPSTILTATLTALNGNGGTSEFSQNDTITNEPTAPVFTANDETCNGSNDAYISVQTYAMNYSILNSDSIFHDNTTITLPSPTGAQTVIVRYVNGCEVTSSGLNVGAGPTPTFTTIVSNDTCGLGGQVIIDASGNSIGTLGTQPYIDVNNNSTTNVNVFSGLTVGTYQYAIVTNYAGYNCYSDTVQVNVMSVDLVADGVMDFTYNDFCASSNGVVTTSPSFQNGTYTVTPSVSINSSTGEIIGATSGTQYTVSYAYGTSCTTSQTVTASAPIDASFSYDAIMNQTDSLCWGNQSSPSATNTGGDFSITGGVGTPSITTTGVINAFPGVYNVEYITSNSACPDTTTVAVTILSLPLQPNITTLDSIICADETPTQLTTQNSVDWYDNLTGNVLASNVSQYQPTNLQVGVNTFYATYIGANGCQSPYDSINIIKPDLSTLSSISDSISICLGSEVELDVTNDNAVSYFWSKNPNVDDSNEPTLLVSPSNDTYYYVALTDTNGCFVHDSILVTIKDPSECNIETYTAFSPNNDNVNDTWIIDGIEGFNENTVYIYNRWGDLIRKIENYDNSTNVWDGTGTLGNTAVAAGTYFYIVEANGTKALSGWVNVVK